MDRGLEAFFPGLEAILAKVAAAAKEHCGLVVAHSGGLDSTVLVWILRSYFGHQQGASVFLRLFHVNYGLRGEESDGDEEFSRRLAADLDLALSSRRVSEEERKARRGETVQEWARRLRFEELRKWTTSGWLVALAHHQGDLAENVLLRLARGSSAGRLAGMATMEPPWIRPLLGYPRRFIENFAKEFEISHREDSTNAKINYARNRIRHRILPELEGLYPGATKRMAQTATDAAAVTDWVRKQLQPLLTLNRTELGMALRTLPEAVAFEALRLVIESDQSSLTPNRPTRLSRTFLKEVLEALKNGGDRLWARDIPGGGRLNVKSGRLWMDQGGDGSKHSRTAQHRRRLVSLDLEAQLEPGSYGFIKTPMSEVSLERSKTETACLSPLKLRVYAASSRKALHFRTPNGLRGFKFKDLMQKWKVIPEDRPAHLAVEVDGELIGIFNGERILAPGADGQPKPVASPITMELLYR